MEKFKAGKYYIGDLCYIFNKSWSDILEISNYFKVGKFSFKGIEMYADRTAYGDGGFKDNFKNSYCVDSGSIGIAPIEALDIDKIIIKDIENLGNIVEFSDDFYVESKNGYFKFGNIIIKTSEEEVDYFYDDDYNNYNVYDDECNDDNYFNEFDDFYDEDDDYYDNDDNR
jgi:hypothetical protein